MDIESYKLLEQLDLAAEFISYKSPSKQRIALILTDNAVELIIHERCLHSLLEASREPTPEANRIAAQEAARVLRNHFKPKVSFLTRIGDILEDENIFCTSAHSIRNTAYHSGLLHEDIMSAIVPRYHELACDLAIRFESISIIVGPNRTPPEIVSKYLPGPYKSYVSGREALLEITKSMTSIRGLQKIPLSHALSTSLLNHLDTLRGDLSYIHSGRNQQSDLSHTLREIQYWHSLLVDAPYGSYNLADPIQKQQWELKLAQFKQTWIPKVSLKTIDSWERRARKLSLEKLPGRALNAYLQLVKDMSDFSATVDESVRALDEAVEMHLHDF